MSATVFNARWPLTNPHAQCILASAAPRAWWLRRRYPELANHEWVTLKLDDGTQLIGQYNRPSGECRDTLLVLFHGWEGSSESNYMLAAAGAALRNGYPVFRLNFRDHGPSHHLNEELFHSCRIDEVVAANKQILDRYGQTHNRLCGFSLGGNFALRTALRAPGAQIALEAALAFSPVVSPHACMDALERTRFYEYYFVRKWRQSLQLKQRHFPLRYDLQTVMRMDSIRALTDALVNQFAGFESLDDYLSGYSVSDERLASLTVPTQIVTAEDDPIIPLEDFRPLAGIDRLKIEVTRHGGHCAWLEGVRTPGWVERRLLQWLATPVAAL